MHWLGVDMGGTATRWALCDDTGALVARGTAPGATGLIFEPALRHDYETTLRAIRAQTGPLAGAWLGITGAGFANDPLLAEVTGTALGLPPENLRVANDMVLAWHAAWPEGGGHVLTAGTGSVAFSLATGTPALVGGRGTLIDDAGSGAWIALAALRALWRHIEETGGTAGIEILAEHLFAALGGSDWEDTRRAVYGAARGAIGTLARPVAEAATAGDPTALALLEDAGHELARLARAVVARAGPAPIAAFGGVFALHSAIRATLIAGTPGLALTFPTLDAPLRAAALARAEFS